MGLVTRLLLVFVVNTIVELCVVIKHVLPVDLLAFVREDEDFVGNEKVLDAVLLEEVVGNVTLGRVEGCQDHTLRGVVFDDRVLC